MEAIDADVDGRSRASGQHQCHQLLRKDRLSRSVKSVNGHQRRTIRCNGAQVFGQAREGFMTTHALGLPAVSGMTDRRARKSRYSVWIIFVCVIHMREVPPQRPQRHDPQQLVEESPSPAACSRFGAEFIQSYQHLNLKQARPPVDHQTQTQAPYGPPGMGGDRESCCGQQMDRKRHGMTDQ